MYIPKDFALDDPARIAGLIQGYNFGLLISARPDGAPVATHLPFLYDPARGSRGTLTAHMARANPQWREFAALREAGLEALAVFSGPHAYVSPAWYGPGDAVPTWNYVAVHAYGTPKLLEDAAVRPMLEALVAAHEAGSAKPWSIANNDEAYMARMQRGIVAFEIPVARLEAKAKLSQNKDVPTRREVAEALRAADHGNAALVEWMEALVLKD